MTSYWFDYSANVPAGASAPTPTAPNYDAMTVAELRELAEERGKAVTTSMKKDELIALLKA